MRVLAIAGVFLGILGAHGDSARAQTPEQPQPPAQVEQATPAQGEQAPPAEIEKRAITIPAGTRVGLSLANPIRTKWARRGDPVRAVTVFPVSAEGQVAIPAGTYVEGELVKVTKRGPAGPAGLEIQFTRVIFESGYIVELDGATAQALAVSPRGGHALNGGARGPSATGYAMANQQTPGLPPPPPPPPPPNLGPNPAVITGVVFGVLAASAVASILWARHRSHDVVFDLGYQFDMVLQNAIALDAESVAAAVAYTSPR